VTLVPEVEADFPSPETVYDVAPELAFQWTVHVVGEEHDTETPVGVDGG